MIVDHIQASHLYVYVYTLKNHINGSLKMHPNAFQRFIVFFRGYCKKGRFYKKQQQTYYVDNRSQTTCGATQKPREHRTRERGEFKGQVANKRKI